MKCIGLWLIAPQAFDELQIRWRKFEAGQLVRFNPLHVRDIQQLRFAGNNSAVEKVKSYRSFGVHVVDREKFILNLDFNSKLFTDFALQSDFQRFAGFHLPAWKFPISGQMDITEASGDKNFCAGANNSRNDRDDHEFSMPVCR